MKYIALCFFILISGCMQTREDIEIIKQEAQERIFNDQNYMPVNGEIDFGEAMARAVKYNLEHKTRVLSKAFENLGTDALKLSYLPDILSQAGYSFKNPIQKTKSSGSAQYSSSESPDNINMQAELSWSSLDFSLGYASYKMQKAKAQMVALEEKKSKQNIFQSIIDNYYKTAIYQHIKEEQEEIERHIDKMLAKVNGIKVERLQNPMQNLRFEQDILSMQRKVKTMANNFENTKIQLGVEMNLKPGTDYNVKIPDFDKLEFQMPSMPIDMIIKKAMEQNPDIGINIYKSLIEEKNLSKSLMRIFPNVTGNLTQSGQFLNEYIQNNTWSSMGMNLSFGLLKILSMPKMKKQLQYYEKITEVRAMAMGIATIAKVSIAYKNLSAAVEDYNLAKKIYAVNMQNYKHIEKSNMHGMSHELESLDLKIKLFLNKIEMLVSVSNIYAAFGRLVTSMGEDVTDMKEYDEYSVRELSAKITDRVDELLKMVIAPLE